MMPNFTITNVMLNLIVEISAIAGQLSLEKRDLHLRKENRIRSIQSSLAIENNSLSLEQVTQIINGKRVLGPPKDIHEVENAYQAYEQAFLLDPYDYRDLLKAHKLLTDGLIKETGKFRSKDVAVYSGENIVHLGARTEFVPKLVKNLLAWAKKSEMPALIKSCVVHFELEIIHPFSDGNGRIGRLWQSLILSKWEPLFEWVPIETVIYQHQQRYYETLSLSNRQNDSSIFLEFMLEAILTTLKSYAITKMSDKTSDILSDKEQVIYNKIRDYLHKHAFITNQKAVALLDLSAASVRRYLVKFVELELLVAQGEKKNRTYYIKE